MTIAGPHGVKETEPSRIAITHLCRDQAMQKKIYEDRVSGTKQPGLSLTVMMSWALDHELLKMQTRRKCAKNH